MPTTQDTELSVKSVEPLSHPIVHYASSVGNLFLQKQCSVRNAVLKYNNKIRGIKICFVINAGTS